MTRPLQSIVTAALADLGRGKPRSMSADWGLLGITPALLASASHHAFTAEEATQMKQDAIRARLLTLMHGRLAMPDLSLIPADVRKGVARRISDDKLAILRVRQHFLQKGPPMRPIVLQALRHAGVDPAGLAAIATVYRSTVEMEIRHGRLAAEYHSRNRSASEDGEVVAGIPLGAGIRLTMMKEPIYLSIPEMPDTLMAALKGRPLAEIVTHPILPTDAIVRRILRASEISEHAAKGPNGDVLLVDFGLEQEPVMHRHLSQGDLEPLPIKR